MNRIRRISTLRTAGYAEGTPAGNGNEPVRRPLLENSLSRAENGDQGRETTASKVHQLESKPHSMHIAADG